MAAHKVGELPVNDGGGLEDTNGYIDRIIVECNEAVRNLAAGQYIGFCSRMAGITSKLLNLKDGVQKEHDALREQVRGLEQANHDLMDKLNNG